MPTPCSPPPVCPRCGAPLHPESSFCPTCAHSIQTRIPLRPPNPLLRRLLHRLLPALLALLALVGIWTVLRLSFQPQTYDARGEVIYTDADGTYQLVLAKPDNRYDPVYEVYQNAEVGTQYRFPVQLYINHVDSGSNAGQLFLQKVDRVEAEFLKLAPDLGTVSCTPPAPNLDYAPDAALVSYVDFTVLQDFTAQMVWSIYLNNGDVIRLRQDLVTTTIRTYDYYPEDAPMDTMADLQALVDQLEETIEPSAVINLHLPAVTYEGTLVIERRAFNLYGTAEDGRRTTFTGSVRLDFTASNQISYLQNIDFQGHGEGIAISSAARAWIENCSFTNWNTGVLGYGYAWVNVIDCRFEGNQTGFHFNSTGSSASHSMYNDNLFQNNRVAVLLENVPTDLTLNFQNTVFTSNETNIENLAQQPLNISQAIFS